MKTLKVIKIGGSVLQKPTDFVKIAHKVLGKKREKICIVTSAMKGITNALIETFLKAIPQPRFWDFEQYAGLGEIQSSYLFEAAFNSIGIRAKAILPWMKEWPLFVALQGRQELSREKINEARNFRLLAKSKIKARRYLLPLLKTMQVVIIPGFIAKENRGRVVTLGRGGSDISALLLSELLGAHELILIKETEGIYNLDPRLHGGARKITALDADELGLIASAGAQVLHPLSLKHQEKLKKIKVTSIETDIHKKSGTQVFFEKSVNIKCSQHIYSVFTFVGEMIPETPGLLSKISRVLAGHDISIYSITLSDNLIALYVKKESSEQAYSLLSPIVTESRNLKFLNMKKDIGKILVRSLKFINEPGIIKKIVSPIAKQGINIWEVLTAHTDVMVFVEHRDLKRTYHIVKKLFHKRKKHR